MCRFWFQATCLAVALVGLSAWGPGATPSAGADCSVGRSPDPLGPTRRRTARDDAERPPVGRDRDEADRPWFAGAASVSPR